MSTQFIRFASVIAALHVAQTAGAQSTFSINNGSATFGAPDAFTSTPILPGDILTPSTGAFPGPNPPAFGAPTPPGTSMNTYLDLGFPAAQRPEIDAMSFGDDMPAQPGAVMPGSYWFSVDEVARGMPSIAPPPTVFTEGAMMVGTFTDYEAAADVFTDLGGAAPPLNPTATAGGNMGMIDGNGNPSLTGAVYPGFGLIEPAGLWPITGDNVDAVNVEGGPLSYPLYFSLDADWTDPVLGTDLLGSAAGFGAQPGDVLVLLTPGGPPEAVPYATAAQLGLDNSGAGTDDLDALALWENGVPDFQPSEEAYDWIGGTTDMLIFSVRRGSAVIGEMDSRYGLPIEEGDLLSTPLVGGVSANPSIWIAAENLGLQTARTFLTGGNTGDDLDALDMRSLSSADCNANGIPDALDIVLGDSSDWNFNGIPDDCELIATEFCFCVAGSDPCGNPYPTGGCTNQAGTYGAILSASGTGSINNDDLFLDMIQLTPSNWGIVFMGTTEILPIQMGNGIRCVGGNLFRFLPAFWTGTGSASYGPIVGLSPSTGSPIEAGETWNFQGWYRDPAGPCTENSNVTNAVSVLFTL
ncbi:MAG: hypothetical protein GY711_03915 [bacterium]|nr:hypothetical protein [bacterium]